MREETEAERAFMTRWLQISTLPVEDAHSIPVREYQFDPARKWRFDFSWPLKMVAVEIEGGTWVKGAHTRGVGFQEDCEKYNRAIELGWRVLRYTPTMVEASPNEVIKQIERVLRNK